MIARWGHFADKVAFIFANLVAIISTGPVDVTLVLACLVAVFVLT